MLVIGSTQQLKMQIAITRPRNDKKQPVVVMEVHRISPLPCIPMVLEHGYDFCYGPLRAEGTALYEPWVQPTRGLRALA